MLITVKLIEYDLAIDAGWNTICIPVRPMDTRIAAVLGTIPYGPVWEWRDGQYHAASHIVPGRGYWLYNGGGPTNVQIAGNHVDLAMDVQPGWNLVGPTGALNAMIPVSTLRHSLGVVFNLYQWMNNSYIVPTEIKCGKGYWLYTERAGIVY